MQEFFVRLALGGVLLATSAAAVAQTQERPSLANPPSEECERPVPPTGIMAPWVNPASGTSGKNAAGLAEAHLRVGQAALLLVHPAGDVDFPVAPGRPGGMGGLAEVTIEEAGNYRVALGTPGWIDLVADNRALASIAHGHGPKCTTIRKMVDFALKPGRYTLVISGNPGQYAQLLIAKLP